MPEFRKVLDIYQGYNFKRDKQTPVGFITRLTLGEKTLKADQTCKNPMNPGEELKVVAVLSDVLWETGVTDAVYFSGQVSVENKQAVQTLIYQTLMNVAVEFQFVVFEYDPLAKRYYRCFASGDGDRVGLLEKRGEELNLSAADDPSQEVQSPINYAFQVGIKPQPEAQALQLAVGEGKHITKKWGLSLG
jgi:hypothetical protein